MSLHDQYSLPKETPLYLLAGTSLLTLIISIISLYFGITIVFQNLLYIPIIIACAFYLKRGFFYSLFLVGLYGILMCVFTGSEEEHIQILLRMGIFILVAGIITYLSQLRLQTTIQYIKSEQKYRHLFLENEAGTALHEIICDESGNPVDYRFLEVNPAFEKMTGLRAADIIGKTVLEVMPGTEPSWIQTYGRVAQSQESIHFEDYSRELERYYAVTAYSPEIGKFATIVIDTTDQKKQEIEITETNEYLENLITYANVPIIVWNPDLVIIRVNHAFEELVGLAQTDLVGQSLYRIFSPEHFDQSIRLISSTQKGARWETVEIPILHSDGSVRTVLWNSSTIYTPDKSTPVATIAQGRDVTVEQMLELEREGAAAQIQENIAKLSILNDEIRNPLTIIAIYAEMVDDSSIHENIKTAIARIDEMVKDLDTAWLNSKKILNYLQKHDNISFDFLQPGHTHAKEGIKGRIITRPGSGITSSSIGSHERFIEEIQKRLYQILDSIDAFVYVTDMETYDILYLNEQARTIYGKNIGKKCYEKIHPEEKGPCSFCTNNLLLSDSKPTGVIQWEWHDAEHGRWYDCRDRAIPWTDGRLVKLEIATDITGRKLAEEELQNRVRREVDIINFLPDPTFAIDTNGIVIAWNHAMEAMTGIAASEMLGKGDYEYSLPIYHKRRPILADLVLSYDETTAAQYQNVTRKGNQIIAEAVVTIPGNGSDRYIWIVASPLYDRSGTVIGAIESIRDITGIKETESALIRSEELYRSIIENIQEVYYRTDREGRLIMASPSCVPLFGYDSVDECIGMNAAELYYEPEEREDFLETIAATGLVENYTTTLRRKDGTPFRVLTNSHYYYDKSGKIAGIEGILRDITEIREAEESLRKSEKRYRTLFETTGTAMVVLENDGTISFANSAFEQLSGFRRDEIEHAMKWMDFVVPDDLERMLQEHRLRREDPASSHAHYEFRFKSRSGDIRYIYLSASLIPQTLQSFASLLDITSRKQAEETLQKKHEDLETTIEELAQTEEELRTSYDELAQSREALAESEERIRKKLESLLSPDGDIGMLDLGDLLDIPALQALMEDFTRVSGMGMAILDATGKVLVATGWQDICTKFHRVHPVTAGFCTESDLHLAANLKEGQYTAYRCRNNLWDVVTPLFFGDRHMGNVFTGQFFYDDDIIDESVFIEQANRHGFDRDEYLAALHRVPRFSHDRVNALMDYLIRLTRFLSLLSYSMLSLARTGNQRDQLIRSLETSEEKYRGIFENAVVGIFQTAPDGSLLHANDALAQMFGYADAHEILAADIDVGRDMYEKPEDRTEVLALLREHEFMEPREFPARDKDKNRFWISLTARTIRDEDGTVIGIEGFCIDITDRKQAEDALQKSEELFRSFLSQIPGTVWAVDQDLKFILSQGRGLSLLDLQPDEVRGMTLYEFFNTDDPSYPAISQHIRALEGETVTYDFTFQGVAYQVYLSPLHDRAGAVIGVAGLALDVSELKAAEQAEQISEERFRMLADNSQDIIFRISLVPETKVSYVSPSVEAITGYSPDDLYNDFQLIRTLVHPDDIHRVEMLLTAEVPLDIPVLLHCITKTGETVWLEIKEVVIRDNDDIPVAIEGNARDVTWRTELEHALRESRDLLNATENLAKVGGFEYDVSEQTMTWTDETYRIYGLEPGAVPPGSTDLISSGLSCYDPDDRQIIEVAFNRCIQEGIAYKFEFPLTTHQGERIWIQTTARPIEKDGKVTRVIGNIIDITERKHTEEALLQVNRKLDLLTSITRHDINNTLTVLSGSVEIAEMKYPDPGIQEYFVSMKKAIETMISQIEFTQVYQNIGSGEPGWHRLQDVIPVSQIPSTIRMTIDLPEIEVYADPMLERGFFTLLDNTIRHGKNVTEIRVSCNQIPEGIVVSWEDNGAGIPGPEKEKIFEQGYGKNTGLGLYLTREILGITGISIRETGVYGEGARFEITVPDGRYRRTAHPDHVRGEI